MISRLPCLSISAGVIAASLWASIPTAESESQPPPAQVTREDARPSSGGAASPDRSVAEKLGCVFCMRPTASEKSSNRSGVADNRS